MKTNVPSCSHLLKWPKLSVPIARRLGTASGNAHCAKNQLVTIGVPEVPNVPLENGSYLF